MHALGFPPVLQRRFVWLLWLALLLLPIAQTVATRHALSHTLTSSVAGASAEGTRSDPAPALHLTACDLCLAGAALVSGALPTAPLAVALAAAGLVLMAALLTGVWLAGPVRAYRSRAPPTASH